MCLNSANESGSLPFKMFITFPLNEQYLNSASLGVLCKGLLEICIEISSRKNSFWHTLFTVALAEDWRKSLDGF